MAAFASASAPSKSFDARRTLARFQPVEFDPAMIELVEATARRLGHSTKRMPSGAGHDAQMLARVAGGLVAVVLLENGRTANIAGAAVHRVRTLLLLRPLLLG